MPDDKPKYAPGDNVPVAPDGPGSSPIVAPEPSGQGKPGTWNVPLESPARTIREAINAGNDAPPGSNWFQWLMWGGIDLAEPQLIWLDQELSGIIFPDWPLDPVTNRPYTLSHILGVLEEQGDPRAKAICDVLAVLLGAGHCVNAQNLKG